MRMCREILAYAKLNQSTMDSTRVISESLASLAKVPDAPAMSELVDAVADQEDRSASEQFVEAHGRFAPPEGSRWLFLLMAGCSISNASPRWGSSITNMRCRMDS